METKIIKYILMVITIILFTSIYFNYNFYNENNNITDNLNQLNDTYNNLLLEHKQLQNDYIILQNNFDNLTNKINLLEESVKDVEVNCIDDNCTGYRRGLLSSIGTANREGKWLICYDSLEDPNAGDKNTKCCESIKGTWHEEKCCAPDNDNSNWIGETGKCSETGQWINK